MLFITLSSWKKQRGVNICLYPTWEKILHVFITNGYNIPNKENAGDAGLMRWILFLGYGEKQAIKTIQNEWIKRPTCFRADVQTWDILCVQPLLF